MSSVAEVLVDSLAAHGVTRVWGVVGDALNPIVDAIASHDTVEWINVRHEEAAAFAAGAEAQLTGTLAVCAGTVGPGALHLINGLFDAKASGAPVLAITGQVPRPDIGTAFHQEVDLDAVFREVVLYNHTLTVAEQLPRVLSTAIRTSLAERGPTLLSIPADLGGADVPDDAVVQPMPLRPARLLPAQQSIDDAVRALDGGERVTILAGIGAAAARDEVIQLADALQAPIVASLRAKDVFEWDNAHYLGLTGLLGNRAAAKAVEDADVLLMIGTDFPYRSFLPDDATVIQVDTDPAAIGRRVPVQIPVLGDAVLVAADLATRVTRRTDRSRLEALKEQSERWSSLQDQMAEGRGLFGTAYAAYINVGDGRLHPELVARTISELADADAVFTADVGLSTVWAARFLDMRSGQRLLGSFNHGSMANALPQALGAQALDLSRQVISLSGDGGLMMLLGDLRTAVEHQLPVKVVVFNNQSLGLVELEEAEMGIPPTGTGRQSPDFAAVAKALGLQAFTISTEDELRPMLEAALATPGPVAIDVHTSADAVSVPPEPTVEQAWGFAVATVRELFQGER